MDELISIPKDHISAYTNRISQIDKEISELDERLKTLNKEKEILLSVIKFYSSSFTYVKPQTTDAGYGTTWWSKTFYILTTENNLMGTGELVDAMVSKEPNMDRESAVKSLSSILTKKVKEGKLIKSGQKFSLP